MQLRRAPGGDATNPTCLSPNSNDLCPNLDSNPLQQAARLFGPVLDGRLLRLVQVGSGTDQQVMALGIFQIHRCLFRRVFGVSYALGFQYPRSEARAYGRKLVEDVIPLHKLTQLRDLRGQSWETDFGTGEPDLFLYKETGEYKFAEVKKQSDRIRQPQLKCLAQIAAVLDCSIEIIYLCEKGRTHTPKTYILDLENFSGHIKR